MLLLFYISLILLFYVYIGYAMLITLIVLLKKRAQYRIDPDYTPMVSVIVPARNEERVIQDKIENLLSLDYPKERMEMIIVSDQSTDQTNSIVQRYQDQGITLLPLDERHGKTLAQNIAVEHSKGEIIIFSDANAMYAKDAIHHLVGHFKNPGVGGVSGELCYTVPHESRVGDEENIYWNLDKFLKKQENRLAGIPGANGSIYAVRKSLYIPLQKDIISDFIEPLLIQYNKHKVIFEPRAKSFEESSYIFKQEFRRKKRIITRSLSSLLQHKYLLNPFKNGGMALQIWSHKVLRWLNPIFLILLFISNIFLLHIPGFRIIFIIQLIFYILAGIGYKFHSNKLPKAIQIALYFCTINLASLLALIDSCRGKQTTVWEPIR